MCRRWRVVVDDRWKMRGRRCSVRRAAHRERLRHESPAEIADQSGGEHDRRERNREGEDRDEGRDRDQPVQRMANDPLPDAPRGVEHDRDDGRLDAVEEARDERHVAVRHVEPRQRDQHDERRQHEQRARDDAAPGAMHEPADVGRELLRFRTRQHHAIVERVQESRFRNPALRLDQIAMHERDLPGRTAEADEARGGTSSGRPRRALAWEVAPPAGALPLTSPAPAQPPARPLFSTLPAVTSRSRSWCVCLAPQPVRIPARAFRRAPRCTRRTAHRRPASRSEASPDRRETSARVRATSRAIPPTAT